MSANIKGTYEETTRDRNARKGKILQTLSCKILEFSEVLPFFQLFLVFRNPSGRPFIT
jgi:hypothetical protein